jgi:Fur family ferric uptake transcriptional regulator
MNFLEEVKKRFQQKHWRFTRNTRAIVIFLNDQTFPVSANDIGKKCGLKMDLATVYRICERLEKIEVVHQFNEKFVKCANPNNKKEEHHFLICEKCGISEEIFLNYKEGISKQLAKEKDFLLKDVDLVFYGVCKNCHRR